MAVKLENRLNSLKELYSITNSQDVITDLVLTLCGEKLGDGAFRDVYELSINPDKFVVKLEFGNTNQNIVEFLIWEEVKHFKGDLGWVKDWFAPVTYLSPNGRVLIMERTFQNTRKARPTILPAFMLDIKKDNFGWLGNKYVCHDYGFMEGFTQYNKKFKNVKW